MVAQQYIGGTLSGVLYILYCHLRYRTSVLQGSQITYKSTFNSLIWAWGRESNPQSYNGWSGGCFCLLNLKILNAFYPHVCSRVCSVGSFHKVRIRTSVFKVIFIHYTMIETRKVSHVSKYLQKAEECSACTLLKQTFVYVYKRRERTP